MIELSQDSVDNKNNESLENKLEEIVSEINKSISEDIKGLDISQLEDMQKDLKELPYISHEEFTELLYPQGQSLGMNMVDTNNIVGSISPAFIDWSTEYGSRKGRVVNIAKQLINPTTESVDNVFHIKDPRFGIKLKQLSTPEGDLFFVMDGSHRVAGCKLARVPRIPALVEKIPESYVVSTYSSELKDEWEKRIKNGLISGNIQEVIDEQNEKSYILKIESQVLPWMYLSSSKIVNLNKFYFSFFPDAKDLKFILNNENIPRDVLTDENVFNSYISNRINENSNEE